MREVSLENKGRGPWRNMNTDVRRVLVPRPKDQDKKQVCDVKGSKQDCFHRNNYQVYHFWINFLKVQRLSLSSLADVSCMPKSSFRRMTTGNLMVNLYLHLKNCTIFFILFLILLSVPVSHVWNYEFVNLTICTLARWATSFCTFWKNSGSWHRPFIQTRFSDATILTWL